MRCGVEVIGRELQARGIAKQSRSSPTPLLSLPLFSFLFTSEKTDKDFLLTEWGAFGVANYLTEKIGGFSSEARIGSHMVEVSSQSEEGKKR